MQLACAASSIIDLVLISFRRVSLSSSAVKGKMHKKGSIVPARETSGFFFRLPMKATQADEKKKGFTVWLAQEVAAKIRHVYLRHPHRLTAMCSSRVS